MTKLTIKPVVLVLLTDCSLEEKGRVIPVCRKGKIPHGRGGRELEGSLQNPPKSMSLERSGAQESQDHSRASPLRDGR